MSSITNHLTLCLLGKTGNGKSATANTLLGNGAEDFEVSSNTCSFTMLVKQNRADITERNGNTYKLNIIDTPGTSEEHPDPWERGQGQNDNEVQYLKVKRTIKLMDDVLRECGVKCVGVNVFVLVFNYSNAKFTEDEREAVTLYKKILGEDVFSNRGIVVFTHGDNFVSTSECPDFKSWCDQQRGGMKDLFKECKDRVYLVNNTVKDIENRDKSAAEIIHCASDLKEKQGPYTRTHWDAASSTRKEIKISYQSQTLKLEFDTEITKLIKELEDLQQKGKKKESEEFRIKIRVYKAEIETKSNGSEKFKDKLKLLDNLEKQAASIGLQQTSPAEEKPTRSTQPKPDTRSEEKVNNIPHANRSCAIV